jgi:hypothetical protein
MVILTLELTHREATAIVLSIEAALHTNALGQLKPDALDAAKKVKQAQRLFVVSPEGGLLGFQKGFVMHGHKLQSLLHRWRSRHVTLL